MASGALDNIVVIPAKGDVNHLFRLKKHLGTVNLKILKDDIALLFYIEQAAKTAKTTKVICSSLTILKILLDVYHKHITEADLKKMKSTEAYQGSMFYHKTHDGRTLEILILPPSSFMRFRNDLKWLIPRWLQKLTNPNFPSFPELKWDFIREDNFKQYMKFAEDCDFCAIDIETVREEIDPELIKQHPEEYEGIWSYGVIKKNSKKKVYFIPKITLCGYAFIFINKEDNSYKIITGVIQVKSLSDVNHMRDLNLTDSPKILQNGGYDITYFLRYNCPLRNYRWDTYLLMHSWLVECKRNLSFICSLFDKDHMYWKDEAEYNAAEYNAKDCHKTGAVFIHMLQNLPQYAMDNYIENFKMQFPCIHCGMEGFQVDEQELRIQASQAIFRKNSIQTLLDMIVGKDFNAGSAKQVLHLMIGLGHFKAKKTDDKAVKEFRNMNILWNYIGELIQDYREVAKLLSTYLEPTLINGRYLYELNPAGTDTGRLASKGSNLWTGGNIQNQPSRNTAVKKIYITDKDYRLNAIDIQQSESRCTAYMSEDKNLIDAVESPLDFHKTNATMFFGITYEEITKTLRQIGKKINHGSNYNMGPSVLLDSMGIKNVLIAKEALKLPKKWNPIRVCTYLLSCFEAAYPDVKGKYYDEVIDDIETTGLLVGPLGWVRKCFGNPRDHKLDLNSYVAHGPQSFSVKAINSAFFDCWLKLQLTEQTLRFKAQVHDELMWQDKPEHTEYNINYIAKRMAQPIEVRGRIMVLPNDITRDKDNWGQFKDDD